MNYTKQAFTYLLLLLTTTLSLTAQRVTDPTAFNAFYHVPNSYTHRLSAVKAIFGYEDLEYFYDNRNNLMRMDHYQTDETSGKRQLVSYDRYLYNKHGQCEQIETYDFRKDNPGLVVSKREFFDYNSKGQVTLYTRWYNHNTVATDTTLVADQKITIEYTESGLPNKAHVRFLDPRNFEWYESFDISLECNARGQLYKRVSKYPDGGTFEEEEITFDKDGRYITSLKLTAEDGKVTEWLYPVDNDGNLTSLGTSDFPMTFSFVSGQAAEKTFYPQPHLATLLLYGMKNYTFLNIPLLYNPSKEAVEADVTNGGNFIYENNKPTAVESLQSSPECTLACDANSWIVYGATVTTLLYDLEGHCLQLVEPIENTAVVHKALLPEGSYLIKSGSQVFKVIR